MQIASDGRRCCREALRGGRTRSISVRRPAAIPAVARLYMPNRRFAEVFVIDDLHRILHVPDYCHFTATLCLKNVTTLIVNNFYKLEPILIIFATLCAETTGC